MIWVLDASVATKWFFTDEPRRAQALAVRAHLANSPSQFVVPHLFMSEMLHVIARKSGNEERFTGAALALLLQLGLRTLDLGEHGWQQAARWCTKGLSGYDATYFALASELSGRWLTDDERAARRAPDLAVTLAAWSAG